jgi:hypothetical protein
VLKHRQERFVLNRAFALIEGRPALDAGKDGPVVLAL